MTTRALEDSELKAIFQHVDGTFALRNETMLVVGIGLALRAAELVLLQVGDVFDGERVKTYVKIRGETAKFGKEREIRVWEIVREKLAEFLEWKESNNESLGVFTSWGICFICVIRINLSLKITETTVYC